MKVKRGDVVLLDHPFSDATGSKVRPSLVVQGDVRNGKLTDTIVALITKNVKNVAKDRTQVLVDLTTTDGKASGLKVDSAVKCGNLYTVHEDDIKKKIGQLMLVGCARNRADNLSGHWAISAACGATRLSRTYLLPCPTYLTPSPTLRQRTNP
jgi:mRNA-degrading endonuclease toxin of MazEF toxin-antitoxin module